MLSVSLALPLLLALATPPTAQLTPQTVSSAERGVSVQRLRTADDGALFAQNHSVRQPIRPGGMSRQIMGPKDFTDHSHGVKPYLIPKSGGAVRETSPAPAPAPGAVTPSGGLNGKKPR